jgi:hypothetical protein
MIIESFNENANYVEGLEASDEFLGETTELMQIEMDSLYEMNNLNIAMARFEHKIYTEAAKAGMLTESGMLTEEEGNESRLSKIKAGASDYAKRAWEAIKKYWSQAIAWFGSLVTKIKAVLFKRKEWLDKHKSEINSVSDAELKDVKVSIGDKLVNANFKNVTSSIASAASTALNDAINIKAGQDAKSIKEKLLSAFKSNTDGNLSKSLHDTLIGESKEVVLTKSLVTKLIGVAENTYSALDDFKSIKELANKASNAHLSGANDRGPGTSGISADHIQAVQSISGTIRGIYAAGASVLSAANGQAMPALVKAYKSLNLKTKVGGMADDVENNGLGGKQENVDLLAAYL